MGTIIVEVPSDIEEKLTAAAAINGLKASELLEQAAAHIAKDYDAYLLFREMQEEGRGLKEEALALLRK